MGRKEKPRYNDGQQELKVNSEQKIRSMTSSVWSRMCLALGWF